jgi:hypothetical protein
MIDMLLQMGMLAASSVIVVRTEPSLASMCPRTPLMIRVAIYMIAAGGLLAIGLVFTGGVPRLPEVLLATGVAVLLICDRRSQSVAKLSQEPPRGAT